jgi:UDP-N-acetylglucosamine 2-epimerase (non-hydrolysing)
MILICFGTRPEYIKLKPLMDKLDQLSKGNTMSYKTLFTGQHKDLVKHKANYNIEIKNGNNRLDAVVSSIMNGIDFKAEGISAVIVQGDTTSAYAMALSAFNHQVKVVHLEAGLRTYNLQEPYPEEANRQMISRITDLHLCPTKTAYANLENEKVPGEIVVVGNTVLDNLLDIETEYGFKVLVTMHRRENHNNIKEWFKQIDKLASDNSHYEFCLPIHPNPAVKKHKNLLKNVKVVEPMDYNILLDYLAKCSFVITDSGGIQEESAFLRKPCLVCRQETERAEGLGNFSLLCKSPEELAQGFEDLASLEMSGDCPYGDGRSSEKIIRLLENDILCHTG